MRKIMLGTTGLSLATIAATLALAAAPSGSPTTRPAPATNVSKHPAIVHIVSRDKTVTISSGPKGLLYSLAGEGGKVLVADASGDDFERLHPELYQHIRRYVAVKNDLSSATSSAAAPASASLSDDMRPIPLGGGALPIGVPLADLDVSR